MPLGLRGCEDWAHRSDEPLLIYHHGAGEFPVERGLARALAAGPLHAPWLLVRAAGHENRRNYQRLMRSASGALAMFASSVAALEGVLRATAPRPVVMTGISLGGMIVLLHAVRYGADWAGREIRWVPVDAGPDFQHIITRGGFSRLQAGRLDPRIVQHRIGRPIVGLPAGRIHPLLALWDQLHCPGVHGRAYEALGIKPEWVSRGHMGLALDGACLNRKWNAELAALGAADSERSPGPA
jgi:alpha-beta hydrolase superfamily lysophospholipase